MNPSDPHTPDDQRIQERNRKALAYLDALRDEEEREDRLKCRALGCLFVLIFNAIFWTAVWLFLRNLGEL
jgi:hypothetical protein